MSIKVTAVLHAALPAPVVVDVAAEVAEADQRRTAQALKIELAAPLVADLAERVSCIGRCMSTAAEFVDVLRTMAVVVPPFWRASASAYIR